MALEYVSIDEAKQHCRIQHDLDDYLIESFIKAASSAVKNYMKGFSVYEPERDSDDDYILDSNLEPVVLIDSNGEKTVREEVKLAVNLLIADWYNNRETKQGGSAMHGMLPDAVIAILYPLRDPALK